jgi:hypothetical protein
MLLAAIGRQMRQIFTPPGSRWTMKSLGRKYVEDNTGVKFPFHAG